MRNQFYFVLSFLLAGCCTRQVTTDYFVYKYEQDAGFDSTDFSSMINYKGNILNENQLKDSIHWDEMVLMDSIFLSQSKTNVYIYQYVSSKFGENVCYVTKDQTKLLGYSSREADVSVYYANKHAGLRKVIVELIKNKKFDSRRERKPLPKWNDIVK